MDAWYRRTFGQAVCQLLEPEAAFFDNKARVREQSTLRNQSLTQPERTVCPLHLRP
jgi:hypothetical protein